jgi:hypothetical protein
MKKKMMDDFVEDQRLMMGGDYTIEANGRLAACMKPDGSLLCSQTTAKSYPGK